jgi:hypothetical protein
MNTYGLKRNETEFVMLIVMIFRNLWQKKSVFKLSRVVFVWCANHESKFRASLEERIAVWEFNVLKSMLFHLVFQSVKVDLRILLGRFWANINIQLEVLNHPEEPVYIGTFFFALSYSDGKKLLGVPNVFETLKELGGKLCQFIPSALNKLLKEFCSILLEIIRFKNFFLIDHDDGLVGKAEVFLKELSEELSGSSHHLVLPAVVRIEENFGSYDVIGAINTQLLGQIWGCDFEAAVCGLCLVVDIWEIDIVVRNMRIGSK